MSLTSIDSAVLSSAMVAGTCPDSLVRAIRAEVRLGLGWQKTADRVVGALRSNLPDPADLLPAPLRHGDPSCYQSHLLYAEPDGSFSVAAMVWLPGQETVIHDHVAWCVTAVLQGLEYEEVFALADGGRALALAARNVNAPWSGTNPPPGPRTSLPVVTRGARRYQHPVHWSHTGPPRHIPAARPNRRGLRPG